MRHCSCVTMQSCHCDWWIVPKSSSIYIYSFSICYRAKLTDKQDRIKAYREQMMFKAFAWLSNSASFTGLGFELTTCLNYRFTNSRSIQESNHIRFCCFWNFALLIQSDLYWYIFASLFPQRQCFILETRSTMWTRATAT